MKQFYESYRNFPTLSAVLREISWTNNLTILSRSESIEEQEFYLKLCSQEKYSSRELEPQINSGVFERTIYPLLIGIMSSISICSKMATG